MGGALSRLAAGLKYRDGETIVTIVTAEQPMQNPRRWAKGFNLVTRHDRHAVTSHPKIG